MREEQVGKTTWQVASRVAEMAARDLEAVKKELDVYGSLISFGIETTS